MRKKKPLEEAAEYFGMQRHTTSDGGDQFYTMETVSQVTDRWAAYVECYGYARPTGHNITAPVRVSPRRGT